MVDLVVAVEKWLSVDRLVLVVKSWYKSWQFKLPRTRQLPRPWQPPGRRSFRGGVCASGWVDWVTIWLKESSESMETRCAARECRCAAFSAAANELSDVALMSRSLMRPMATYLSDFGRIRRRRSCPRGRTSPSRRNRRSASRSAISWWISPFSGEAIVGGPVEQVQVVVVDELGRVQDPLRHLQF